jgi:hypothetical protein
MRKNIDYCWNNYTYSIYIFQNRKKPILIALSWNISTYSSLKTHDGDILYYEFAITDNVKEWINTIITQDFGWHFFNDSTTSTFVELICESTHHASYGNVRLITESQSEDCSAVSKEFFFLLTNPRNDLNEHSKWSGVVFGTTMFLHSTELEHRSSAISVKERYFTEMVEWSSDWYRTVCSIAEV